MVTFQASSSYKRVWPILLFSQERNDYHHRESNFLLLPWARAEAGECKTMASSHSHLRYGFGDGGTGKNTIEVAIMTADLGKSLEEEKRNELR